MKLALTETKYLKDSISIISELVNEATFKVTKNGLELLAMDPANVAMVSFKLLSSSFSIFEIDKDTEISINLVNLKQVLKRARATDVLYLEISEDNRLKVEFKGGTVRTFYLPIIDIEEKEQEVPELNFDATVKMQSSLISETIEDVDIVAESVSLLAEKGALVVEAEGDLSKAHIEIKEDEETSIVLKGDKKVKAKYSVEYLKKMMNASKLSERVTLEFSNDYPLKMEFVEVDKLSLAFILAPRVDTD